MYPRQEREIPLRNRSIARLKVQWKHFGLDEATWEMEDAMKLAYPFLFTIVYITFGLGRALRDGIVTLFFPPVCKYKHYSDKL